MVGVSIILITSYLANSLVRPQLANRFSINDYAIRARIYNTAYSFIKADHW